jgi:hypothetical protein
VAQEILIARRSNIDMRIVFPIALGIAVLAGPALAQGNSPYNRSGSQAGGPLAGQERRMGDPGGTPAFDPAPPAKSIAGAKRRKHPKRRNTV